MLAAFHDRARHAWLPILLAGIGVSSIGDFIYLVALNVLILDRTHSPAAVAGLWLMSRLAALAVGPFAGSVVDRFPHRTQLAALEIVRAFLVALLPFASSIGAMYALLFVLGMASTLFNNAFLPYLTLLVPETKRQQVNARVSVLRHGAVLIGPAVAGILLVHGAVGAPFWLDAGSFLVSGLSLLILPAFPVQAGHAMRGRPAQVLHADWQAAWQWLRQHPWFAVVACLNMLILVCAVTADTQEVVFAQDALHLGRFGYSALVMAAGAGFAAGSILLTTVVRRLRTDWLAGAGRAVSAAAYLGYALSHSMLQATIGLVLLGLAGSAAGVGYTTYLQRMIPVHLMGRVNNLLGTVQQGLAIGGIVVGGLIASGDGVRQLMVDATVPMCLLATAMAAFLLIWTGAPPTSSEQA